jgi:hypothetical protein
MDRYSVFTVGSTFYRLHGVDADEGQAVGHYNRVVARTEAVLARAADTGAVTVLAAGGLNTEGVARDPIFLDAIRAAHGQPQWRNRRT